MEDAERSLLAAASNGMADVPAEPGQALEVVQSLAALQSHMAAPGPIPFNRFCKAGNEFAYIEEAINAMHVSGDGRFTERCHQILEAEVQVQKALLTTSCTHALEMAALLLDIQPGDEVILPSFTFVSTANAFVLRGAKPVFSDVRADTLNLDESKLESLITPRTRAILPVHYGGIACEMDAILSIARSHGVAVVEDNAHGLFGNYRGRPLGSLGAMSTLSFHETKNISCGEGGALLINDSRFSQRAEVLREKGTNRKRFFRGEVDRYSWVDVGSSYLPSEILAAVLCAQLEARQQIQEQRRRIWDNYSKSLAPWARQHGVTLPHVPQHCDPAYHLFYILLPQASDRPRLIAHLKQEGILSVFHYLPLHLSEMGLRYGGQPGDCPVVEDSSERLLRLPFFNGLRLEDQSRAIECILSFRF